MQRDKPIDQEAASCSCAQSRPGERNEGRTTAIGGRTREGVGAIYRAQKGAEQSSIVWLTADVQSKRGRVCTSCSRDVTRAGILGRCITRRHRHQRRLSPISFPPYYFLQISWFLPVRRAPHFFTQGIQPVLGKSLHAFTQPMLVGRAFSSDVSDHARARLQY